MTKNSRSDVLTFLGQYARHPRRVGALLPSSTALVEKMVTQINFDQALFIVELGAGTGRFTEEILRRRNALTQIVLIERDPVFFSMLKKRFGHQAGVHLFHDSAENIEDIVQGLGWDRVDYVLSGLPFASLPVTVTHSILNCSRKVLGAHGRFVLFQYSHFKLGLIRSYFPHIHSSRVLWNVPPAYVLKCHHQE